jgi:undecaprenyl phosphate-alpha-L-ara4FN deformylase
MIAMRVAVATAHGADKAVPLLAEMLARHRAGATFFFNLGPARANRFLPGAEVGRTAADAIRRVHEAGFEVGIYGWDPLRWQARIAAGDHAWLEQALERACERFEALFAQPVRAHAAPGWTMNRHAFRLTQRFGFDYGSDTRGTGPFIPLVDAEIISCPQIPTTLPPLSELVRGGLSVEEAERNVLAASQAPSPAGHVFALDADSDDSRLMPSLERLLGHWTEQSQEIVPLRTLGETLDPKELPHHVVDLPPPGARRAVMALQGAPFLA